MRILLIEDDSMIGKSVQQGLSTAGFAVDWVTDGRAAELALGNGVYDLAVLDLGLPKKDGMAVLARLREMGDSMPVLIASARDTVGDRISGLNAGADDYLLKPFEPQELLARLRALLRRAQGDPSPSITVGRLTFERANGAFRLGDELLELPRRERAVLEQLVIRVGKIVLREKLSDMVFGLDEEVGPNALEVYIGRLRKRLAAGGPHIRTVRGLGYMLERM